MFIAKRNGKYLKWSKNKANLILFRKIYQQSINKTFDGLIKI